MSDDSKSKPTKRRKRRVKVEPETRVQADESVPESTATRTTRTTEAEPTKPFVRPPDPSVAGHVRVKEPGPPPQRSIVTQMKHTPGADKSALDEIVARAERHGYTDCKWETIDGAKHKIDRLTGVR